MRGKDGLEPRSSLGTIGAGLLFGVATIGAVQFLRPSAAVPTAPLSRLAAAVNTPTLAAAPASDAFGLSGNVKVRFALPGQAVEFPVNLTGAIDSLTYQWVPFGDSISTEPVRALSAAALPAPARPGFYRLALVHGLYIPHQLQW